MKRFGVILLVVGAVAIFVCLKLVQPAAERPVHTPAQTQATDSAPSDQTARLPVEVKPKGASPVKYPAMAKVTPSPEQAHFAAAIATLSSPDASYGERMAALKELKDSGRLGDAVTELTQRMNADTNNAIYPATLGEAYLRMCGTTQDVRAQAVWAMTADVDFDTALDLDPSNWEARFTKAMAMTYWPQNMGKGPDIISQFNTLIDQQSQEAPEPQFAKTYLWLGTEYQNTGQTDLARQTWQQGATLFPSDQGLQGKLAAAGATAQ